VRGGGGDDDDDGPFVRAHRAKARCWRGLLASLCGREAFSRRAATTLPLVLLIKFERRGDLEFIGEKVCACVSRRPSPIFFEKVDRRAKSKSSYHRWRWLHKPRVYRETSYTAYHVSQRPLPVEH